MRIPGQSGIGTEIRGYFLGLILKDGRLSSKQRVIVLQGETNRFIESDTRGLRLAGVRAWRLGLCG